MPSSTRYLIDSDVLISAKNLHYRPGFCEAFWGWIVDAHKAGLLFSIDKVKDELLAGNDDDPLYDWAQKPGLNGFFLASEPGAQKWKELSKWAVEGGFIAAAIDKFLGAKSADAWLIAFAAAEGKFVIITNEVSAPQGKKAIKLPDAAAAVGVKTISLFEVLQLFAHRTFELKT